MLLTLNSILLSEGFGPTLIGIRILMADWSGTGLRGIHISNTDLNSDIQLIVGNLASTADKFGEPVAFLCKDFLSGIWNKTEKIPRTVWRALSYINLRLYAAIDFALKGDIL